MTTSWISKVAAGIIAVVICLIGVGLIFGGIFETKHDVVVVVDKDVVCDIGPNDDVSCEHLVFTNKGTFMIDNSMMSWNGSIRRAFSQVIICHKYDIKYYGWKKSFFSGYPSIVKMKDLGDTENCH